MTEKMVEGGRLVQCTYDRGGAKECREWATHEVAIEDDKRVIVCKDHAQMLTVMSRGWLT